MEVKSETLRWEISDQADIASKLSECVESKDHGSFQSKYRGCFSGTELLDQIVALKYSEDAGEGTGLVDMLYKYRYIVRANASERTAANKQRTIDEENVNLHDYFRFTCVLYKDRSVEKTSSYSTARRNSVVSIPMLSPSGQTSVDSSSASTTPIRASMNRSGSISITSPPALVQQGSASNFYTLRETADQYHKYRDIITSQFMEQSVSRTVSTNSLEDNDIEYSTSVDHTPQNRSQDQFSVPLLQDYGGWLKKSQIKKVGPISGTYDQKRYFRIELQSRCLAYYANEKDVYPLGYIDLCDLIDISPNLQSKDNSQFIIAMPNRILAQRAKNSIEATQWITQITTTMDQLRTNNGYQYKKKQLRIQHEYFSALPSSFEHAVGHFTKHISLDKHALILTNLQIAYYQTMLFSQYKEKKEFDIQGITNTWKDEKQVIEEQQGKPVVADVVEPKKRERRLSTGGIECLHDMTLFHTSLLLPTMTPATKQALALPNQSSLEVEKDLYLFPKLQRSKSEPQLPSLTILDSPNIAQKQQVHKSIVQHACAKHTSAFTITSPVQGVYDDSLLFFLKKQNYPLCARADNLLLLWTTISTKLHQKYKDSGQQNEQTQGQLGLLEHIIVSPSPPIMSMGTNSGGVSQSSVNQNNGNSFAPIASSMKGTLVRQRKRFIGIDLPSVQASELVIWLQWQNYVHSVDDALSICNILVKVGFLKGMSNNVSDFKYDNRKYYVAAPETWQEQWSKNEWVPSHIADMEATLEKSWFSTTPLKELLRNDEDARHWEKGMWLPDCAGCIDASVEFSKYVSTISPFPFAVKMLDSILDTKENSLSTQLEMIHMSSVCSLLTYDINTHDKTNKITNSGVLLSVFGLAYCSNLSVRMLFLQHMNMLFSFSNHSPANQTQLLYMPGWSDWIFSLVDDIVDERAQQQNLLVNEKTISSMFEESNDDFIDLSLEEQSTSQIYQMTIHIAIQALMLVFTSRTKTCKNHAIMQMDNIPCPNNLAYYGPHISRLKIEEHDIKDEALPYNDFKGNIHTMYASTLTLASSFQPQLHDCLLSALSRSKATNYTTPRTMLLGLVKKVQSSASLLGKSLITFPFENQYYLQCAVKSFVFAMDQQTEMVHTKLVIPGEMFIHAAGSPSKFQLHIKERFGLLHDVELQERTLSLLITLKIIRSPTELGTLLFANTSASSSTSYHQGMRSPVKTTTPPKTKLTPVTNNLLDMATTNEIHKALCPEAKNLSSYHVHVIQKIQKESLILKEAISFLNIVNDRSFTLTEKQVAVLTKEFIHMDKRQKIFSSKLNF